MASVQETGLIIKVLADSEEKEISDELSSLYNNRIEIMINIYLERFMVYKSFRKSQSVFVSVFAKCFA